MQYKNSNKLTLRTQANATTKALLRTTRIFTKIGVYDTQTLKVLVGSEFGRLSFLFLLLNTYCIQ